MKNVGLCQFSIADIKRAQNAELTTFNQKHLK